MIDELEQKLKLMKRNSSVCANFDSQLKNHALANIVAKLNAKSEVIFEANTEDLRVAEANDIDKPILKRLKFDSAKLAEVCGGIEGLQKLPDPVNHKLSSMKLDDGLILDKIAVPIGVIGVIFESRPDALVQIASLCVKSGNCAVLKGGSEAANTNRVLAKLINEALLETDSRFAGCIELIETRDDVAKILQYSNYINLIIPRGSNAFVQYIQKNSMIPVLGHADGICHVYVDEYADIEKAIKVVVDSKTQYVSVCNATETLLVHSGIAQSLLPKLTVALRDKGVELRCCPRTLPFVDGGVPATDEDWATEYLDYILSIKMVDSIEDAVEHINYYGSGHTDCIVTENVERKKYFQAYVDTASVMFNCSTRFADGFRYGMGAEVGVSTNKFHARGPVGLEGLVIYKYLLEGDAHVVADYSDGSKSYKHEKLPL